MGRAESVLETSLFCYYSAYGFNARVYYTTCLVYTVAPVAVSSRSNTLDFCRFRLNHLLAAGAPGKR